MSVVSVVCRRLLLTAGSRSDRRRRTSGRAWRSGAARRATLHAVRNVGAAARVERRALAAPDCHNAVGGQAHAARAGESLRAGIRCAQPSRPGPDGRLGAGGRHDHFAQAPHGAWQSAAQHGRLWPAQCGRRRADSFCSAGSWCTSRGCALPRRRLASRLRRLR